MLLALYTLDFGDVFPSVPISSQQATCQRLSAVILLLYCCGIIPCYIIVLLYKNLIVVKSLLCSRVNTYIRLPYYHTVVLVLG